MWQTKYASAVPKNLGLGFDFRLCCAVKAISSSGVSSDLHHCLILKRFNIFCRYHYNVDGRRKHVLPQEGKFVLTQDQGLVIIGLAEKDAGQYDCRVNHETINSYR